MVAGLKCRESVIAELFPLSQTPIRNGRQVTGIGAYAGASGTLQLSLRSQEDDQRLRANGWSDNPVDWQHCILECGPEGEDVFGRVVPPEVAKCCEWIQSWVESSAGADPIDESNVMFWAKSHLLAMATAEALLSEPVRNELKRQSIFLRDNSEDSCYHPTSVGFEFVVRERDGYFNSNYCDLVLAQRYTDHVLNGGAKRDAKQELAVEERVRRQHEEFFQDTGIRIKERVTVSQLRAWLRWIINRKS